jgi:hypothetical protein
MEAAFAIIAEWRHVQLLEAMRLIEAPLPRGVTSWVRMRRGEGRDHSDYSIVVDTEQHLFWSVSTGSRPKFFLDTRWEVSANGLLGARHPLRGMQRPGNSRIYIVYGFDACEPIDMLGFVSRQFTSNLPLRAAIERRAPYLHEHRAFEVVEAWAPHPSPRFEPMARLVGENNTGLDPYRVRVRAEIVRRHMYAIRSAHPKEVKVDVVGRLQCAEEVFEPANTVQTMCVFYSSLRGG